jgi:hypothetical protein
MRSALHLGLERFFNACQQPEITVDPSAFTKARAHLKASAFVELNELLLQTFHQQEATAPTPSQSPLEGRRFLAVDGSTLRLPNTPAMQESFGGQQGLAMARISTLYDLHRKSILAARLSPYHIGEHEQAMELLGGVVGPGDCVVLDRGYHNNAFLFAWIIGHGADFLVRRPTKGDARVEAFLASGALEQMIEYHLPAWVVEERALLGLALAKTISLRLVRVELSSGELEVLMSTLTDREEFPAKRFGEYYHGRWGIEECYKRLKCYIEPENWSGKSVLSVEQDFHAAILRLNLAALAAHYAQPILEEELAEKNPRKHPYVINLKRACGLLRDELCALIRAGEEERRTLLGALLRSLTKAAVPIRPERSYPHRIRRRQPPSFAYKPI